MSSDKRSVTWAFHRLITDRENDGIVCFEYATALACYIRPYILSYIRPYIRPYIRLYKLVDGEFNK